MIAECLIIKDESRYLLEHLTYNAAAGIDHFFIYDNMSRTPVWEYLRENAPDLMQICTFERYIGRGNTQIDCYADYLQKWRGEVEWSLFCDTDECFTGNIRDAVAVAETNFTNILYTPVFRALIEQVIILSDGLIKVRQLQPHSMIYRLVITK